MGKNLTRLFKDRAVRNQAGIEAHNKLGWIWDRHGEALITALENLQYWCDELQDNEVINPQSPFWERIDESRQLLAQLEAEAQP